MEEGYARYYVDLGGLKIKLNRLKGVTGTEPGDIAVRLNSILEDEVQKVNQFSLLKHQELAAEMQVVYKNLKTFGKSIEKSRASLTAKEASQFLSESENSLSDISLDIVHLDRFVRVNFSSLVKGSLYFDELFGKSAAPWFMAQLTREPFAGLDIDRLLITLSLCWEKFRSVKQLVVEGPKSGQTASTWKPPESFVRNTTKYWLRPDKVAAAKAIMVRYVPYLIFGYSSKELEFLVDPFELSCKLPADSKDVKEGQLVSSIYLDSEGGHSYYERISRHEGAKLIRCRWYGENVGDPYTDIFVERKTHHEGWSGDQSTKERFSLPQKRIFEFLKGKIDIDVWARYLAQTKELPMDDKKIKNMIRLGHEISDYVQQHKLQPMVRTSYLRSAFQASDNNDVRFSLDVNLCMVNEYRSGGHPTPPWCRVSEEILGKDEVVRFPYAVLEVKLQAEQPAWVSQMLFQSQAMMVYKFSKFQHGMAFLHRDKVGIHGLPHWIPDFESRGFVPGFSIPASQGALNSQKYPSTYVKERNDASDSAAAHSASRFNAMLTSNGAKGHLLASFYPGTSLVKPSGRTMNSMRFSTTRDETSLLKAIHDRAKTVQKLDPKSIFASERTLLHYIQKCMFVLAIGLALIEATDRVITYHLGLLLIFTSIIGIIISYHVYEQRTHKIVNRFTKALVRERLDNQWAPIAACILVSFGLLTTLVTTMIVAI